MSRKRSQVVESHAVATLPSSAQKPSAKMAAAHDAISGIRSNPDLANHADLQQSVTDWQAVLDGYVNRGAQITNLKAQLTGLEHQQLVAVATEQRASDKTLGLLNVICAGSETAIKAYGLPLRTRTTATPSTDAPLNVRAKQPVIPGPLVLQWKRVVSAYAYFVQISSDGGQTWGAPLFAPKSKYTLSGLTPGQTVQIRVQVERKSVGASLWSSPISFVVR